ncbi:MULTISPECIES: phage tail tape measure protein [Bhargavaea]|uniref:Phage tail tape measure protein n=1 Tax=Bhargavaea changchunensis TaxID=2134037 RepID=A0ABW2NEP9_9BACL|nr:phage tail tape measure protein [Bhargavaea sp. CC-171006]
MAQTYAVEAILKANTTGFEQGFRAAAEAARNFQSSIDRISTAGIERAGREFQTAGNNMKSAGKSVMGIGAGLTAGLTVPIVGAAAAASKLGMDFDDSMAQVSAVSGATGSDLDKLRGLAREMGATTRYSASEAAEGLNYMAMAGWKTDQMMAGLPAILNLAAAAGEDLGVTSDIVTDALTGFGLKAEDAGMFADVLAAASSNANTNVAMLGESFKYVAPVAGALGYSAQDVAVALGLMANAGIKGSQAGTSLRTMMTNLSAPTKQMQEAMDDLGISITDSSGEMKPFATLMEELRTKFSTLDEAQQAQYASTIFGKEAMAGALAIINASSDDYDKLTTAINESEGAAAKMAAIMEGTLGGTWRSIRSAVEELALKLYEQLRPALQAISDAILTFINWLNTASPAVQKVAVALGIFLAAIGPLIAGIGLLIFIAGSLIGNFGVLATKFAPLIANSALLRVGFAGISRAISLIFGPVGVLIAVLLSLIPVFVRLYQENETFRNVVQTVWSFIQNIITQVVSAVVSFVMDLWGQLVAFWNENGQMILQATQNAWSVISSVISVALSVIAGVFRAVWPALQIIVSVVWSAIKGVIQGALNIILGLAKTFAGLFTGNWSKMWSGVKQLFSGALQFVWNLLQLTFLGKMMGAVRTFAGLLRGGVSSMWSAVRGIFTSALNSIRSFFSNSFNTMKNIANTSLSTIRSTVSNVLSAIRSVFSSSLSTILSTVRSKFLQMVSAIRSALSTAVSTVRSMITNMITAVKSGASRMVTAGKDLIRGLINGIKNMGAAAIGAITRVVDGVINKAKSLLKIKSPSRVFRQFGEYTSEGLAIGVSSEAGAAIRAVSDMASGMTKAFVPDLAMPEGDYAKQIRTINSQAERQLTAQFDSELSVSRQPAYISLRIGSGDFEAFVEDISRSQDRMTFRRRRRP